MLESEQRVNCVELGGEAQLDWRVPLAEEADGIRKRAREVLNTERVGVAGGLKCGAFGGAGLGLRSDRAAAQIFGQRGENLGRLA